MRADPHSFNLSDLSRPSHSHSHSYIPQPSLAHPQQDVFSSTMNPFAQGIPGMSTLPGASVPYGQSYSQSPIMSSGSPLAPHHQTLYNSSYVTPNMHTMHLKHSSGGGNGLATSPMMNQHQTLNRLSLSGPSGSSYPADPMDLPGGGAVNITPPRTAQDLLMRVLGTSNATSGRAQPNAHSYAPTSPVRAAVSPSSPESRPAPLLFGTSGNSIWAP
jgi:hypothetical protein